MRLRMSCTVALVLVMFHKETCSVRSEQDLRNARNPSTLTCRLNVKYAQLYSCTLHEKSHSPLCVHASSPVLLVANGHTLFSKCCCNIMHVCHIWWAFMYHYASRLPVKPGCYVALHVCIMGRVDSYVIISCMAICGAFMEIFIVLQWLLHGVWVN